MPKKQSLILKKEMMGAELPFILKLNRENHRLQIFGNCGNEQLYGHFPVRKSFDFSDYTIFEEEFSFPCIFGGNTTPTPAGLFRIEEKSTAEYISSYYPNYSKVKFFGYLVVFEDYFIHSDLYAADEVSPSESKAISRNDETTSGCIRVSPKNLTWLIENIDIGTLVFL